MNKNVNANGLSEREAARRLGVYGHNVLKEQKRKSALMIFLSQFKDVLILILAVACLFSVVLGEFTEAITIITIMLLNAFMGFIQEFRTEKTLAALRNMSAPVARVVRGGALKTVPAELVVPGDYIRIKAGDRIPADCEVVTSVNLATDESILSGESTPVLKKPGGAKDSVMFMGTSILEGHGDAVVKSTGMSTEMGAIAGMMGEAEEQQTPLQKRLAKLGTYVAICCLVICVVVAGVGILRGSPVLDMIMIGLSLAVAAIPEGLPAIITVVLALSVNRILERGTIIRKLHAVETLGSASVICSDKTGTITENKMTVAEIYADGEFYKFRAGTKLAAPQLTLRGKKTDAKQNLPLSLAFKCVTLCSTATVELRKNKTEMIGSPTEVALMRAAHQNGIERAHLLSRSSIVSEVPFDSAKKYMSVTVRDNGKLSVLAKGAPDILIKNCSFYAAAEGARRMGEEQRIKILAAAEEMAARALRVIAAVYKDGEEENGGYTLLALFGIYDPPRPEVKQAVAQCRTAGITPVMITGDHRITAEAIAREVGIVTGGEKVLEGERIEQMTDAQLQEACKTTAVFARVSPKHKLRIVRAFKALGHVVAMTGDGVNDAPAIKEADIGVAMGVSGSDVTKEASSVVILDDNFATIVSAVEEGRVIYSNIRRFISFMLASNLGEVLTVLLGMLFNMPVIFIPIQILLINLVTDGLPAVALGMEKGGSGIMERPPRPKDEGLFAGGMLWNIVFRGAILGLSNVLCFSLVYQLTADIAISRSAVLLTLIVSQMLYVYECRSATFERGARKGLFANKTLFFACLGSLLVSFAVVYIPPLQGIFATAPVTGTSLLYAAATTAISPVVGFLTRWLNRKEQSGEL